MAYLGASPAVQTTAMSYQDLTGGSGTAFTLDYPVASASEVEVYVNNVRQEPSVAYTVSGTALTMTGSVSASDDFYVVFQGKAIVSNDVSGAGGFFDGNNGATGDTATGKGDIFRVHSQTLTNSVTIGSTDNAMAVGPLTIDSSVTLTVNGNLTVV